MPTFQQARAIPARQPRQYDAALKGLPMPEPVAFNWAIDWFDAELARSPESREPCGLWIVDVASGEETKLTFGELGTRSNQVANHLRGLGLRAGDHLLLVLNNVAPLWGSCWRARARCGGDPRDHAAHHRGARDRVQRGRAKMIIAGEDQAPSARAEPRWRDFVHDQHQQARRLAAARDAYKAPTAFQSRRADQSRRSAAAHFTSGTTAQAQLLMHQHRSYPVGALSTMYWLGLQPGDVHVNISCAGPSMRGAPSSRRGTPAPRC